jgi:hypothetical protein
MTISACHFSHICPRKIWSKLDTRAYRIYTNTSENQFLKRSSKRPAQRRTDCSCPHLSSSWRKQGVKSEAVAPWVIKAPFGGVDPARADTNGNGEGTHQFQNYKRRKHDRTTNEKRYSRGNGQFRSQNRMHAFLKRKECNGHRWTYKVKII